MNHNSFSSAIVEQLGFYVYLLIDPQSGEIFYVGKGTGNRIFAHLNEAVNETTENTKLDRIRDIRARGQEVMHVIHRHGLTEKEAFEVEAALIDLVGLSDLTNIAGGYHSRDRGPLTVEEIIAAYDAPAIDIQEPAMLVLINRLYHRGMTDDELYRTTRGDWVVGPRREHAEYVFAVSNALVRQVYEVELWEPVDEPGATSQRWRFEGHVAEALQHYVGGSVAHYITRGAQNPVKYVNC